MGGTGGSAVEMRPALSYSASECIVETIIQVATADELVQKRQKHSAASELTCFKASEAVAAASAAAATAAVTEQCEPAGHANVSGLLIYYNTAKKSNDAPELLGKFRVSNFVSFHCVFALACIREIRWC